MEQVTVKMTPSKSTNPVINRTTTDATLNLSDVVHDTYTLDITSDVYKPYKTTVVVNGETSLNIHLEALVTQQVEWRPKQRVTTIPITTTYTDDPTLNKGVEIEDSAGTQGKTTITWEAEYINGVATGKKRNEKTVTVDMVPRKVRRGTKPVQVELNNVLTQANTEVTYSTNTYVDGTRTEGDAVPTGGSAFELRQWENPSGGLTISDGDLEANKPYTLAFTMERTGGSPIQTAHFVIGMTFFGGKHYFNGVEKSIPPDAGQYVFTSHMTQSGKVTYYFQFTTESDSPTGDYFQLNFDNDANDTRVTISDLALYEGHVDPFEQG